jgi:hypothetical protein
MRLQIELPDRGVVAVASLYSEAAPTVSRLVYDALATPLEAKTAHACFDGQEVYCFLPAFSETPPLENRTMRPRPGEIMFFHAPEHAFAVTSDDRLSGGSSSVFELAFMYGEVDLRHYWEEGFHGSLVGRIDSGLEAFAEACAQTLVDGQTALRVSQAEEG